MKAIGALEWTAILDAMLNHNLCRTIEFTSHRPTIRTIVAWQTPSNTLSHYNIKEESTLFQHSDEGIHEGIKLGMLGMQERS